MEINPENMPTLADLQARWIKLKAEVEASADKRSHDQALDQFRQQCIAAGRYIRSQRKDLFLLVREVGDLVYQIEGSYPNVILDLFQARPNSSTEFGDVTSSSQADQLFQIAQSLDERGQFQEAEILYIQASAMYVSSLSPGDPKLLECLNELGCLYGETGRGTEMETTIRSILVALQATKGTKHPDRAVALNNLAAAYRIQGRLDEAEATYLQAMEIDRDIYGENNTEYATDILNLAEVFVAQKHYSDAAPLCRDAVEVYIRDLGLYHSDTILAIGTYASVLYLVGNEEQALELIKPVANQLFSFYRKQTPEMEKEFKTQQQGSTSE